MKYLIISDQKVKTKWVGKTKSYYESKGYIFSGMNTTFDVVVEDLKPSSTIKVKFICDFCKGENQKNKYAIFSNIMRGRKLLNKDCCDNKICKSRKNKEINERRTIELEDTLKYTHPILANQWNFKKNNNLTPLNVTKYSNKKVWWVCEKGHEWKANVSQRTIYHTSCPFCSGRLASEENNLATHNPNLALEWNQSKNGNITPFDVTYGSTKKVWWICESFHEYKMSVNDRSSGRKCPYCSGKRVCLDNCLSTTHPELSAEWNYKKNRDKTPYNTTFGSNKKYWWICDQDHEWNATLHSRSNGHGCPYCSGRVATKDNNLSVMNFKLTSEWHRTKNGSLTPLDVLPKSKKKVWWIGDCGHEWEASIDNRTKGNNCPLCNESKGEKEIRKWLDDNNVQYESQKEFEGLVGVGGGNLSYDFYLSMHNILIEYQGEYHDGKGNYHMKRNLEKQKEHDRRKCDYATQNGIRLLEIWYWDYDKIQVILENNLFVV